MNFVATWTTLPFPTSLKNGSDGIRHFETVGTISLGKKEIISKLSVSELKSDNFVDLDEDTLSMPSATPISLLTMVKNYN
jgi:hypothetical protein